MTEKRRRINDLLPGVVKIHLLKGMMLRLWCWWLQGQVWGDEGRRWGECTEMDRREGRVNANLQFSVILSMPCLPSFLPSLFFPL